MRKPAKGSLTPRNGHLAAMLFRKAGAHQKTGKALRREAKLDLAKALARNSMAGDHDCCPGADGGPWRAGHVQVAKPVGCIPPADRPLSDSNLINVDFFVGV